MLAPTAPLHSPEAAGELDHSLLLQPSSAENALTAQDNLVRKLLVEEAKWCNHNPEVGVLACCGK